MERASALLVFVYVILRGLKLLGFNRFIHIGLRVAFEDFWPEPGELFLFAFRTRLAEFNPLGVVFPFGGKPAATLAGGAG